MQHLGKTKRPGSRSDSKKNGLTIPKHSMYGIFTYIGVVLGVNVCKYAIHGVSDYRGPESGNFLNTSAGQHIGPNWTSREFPWWSIGTLKSHSMVRHNP